MVDFGRKVEPAAQEDERVAVSLGDAEHVFDPASKHWIALVEVELQVAEQGHHARLLLGEQAIQQLHRVQRVGTSRDPLFGQIDQSLGG